VYTNCAPSEKLFECVIFLQNQTRITRCLVLDLFRLIVKPIAPHDFSALETPIFDRSHDRWCVHEYIGVICSDRSKTKISTEPVLSVPRRCTRVYDMLRWRDNDKYDVGARSSALAVVSLSIMYAIYTIRVCKRSVFRFTRRLKIAWKKKKYVNETPNRFRAGGCFNFYRICSSTRRVMSATSFRRTPRAKNFRFRFETTISMEQ